MGIIFAFSTIINPVNSIYFLRADAAVGCRSVIFEWKRIAEGQKVIVAFVFDRACIAQEQGWPLEGSKMGVHDNRGQSFVQGEHTLHQGIRRTRKEGNRVLEVHRVFRLPRKFGTGFVQVEVSTLPAIVGRITRDW
ncbi:hypothetical protein Acr_12g0003050 [Actinidia rufa]|uniref:Uncharacterized protein n=1 Tax=Actinidia rufa TaxID=165716 RepID=A0A7J0FGD2_9ERIC|nr:hypothetical protein Acr_12g0003050 [Actinidia rufa]